MRHREREGEGEPAPAQPEHAGGDRQAERPARGVEGECPGHPGRPGLPRRRVQAGLGERAQRSRPASGATPRAASVAASLPALAPARLGAQLVGERGGAEDAARGRARARLLERGSHPGRQVGRARLDRRRPGADPPGRPLGARAAEGVVAGEGLPEHHPDGPDVGRRRGRLAGETFGGDVGQRPRDVSDRRQRLELRHLREPEVEQAHVGRLPLAEQHVGGLDVAVDDPAAVCVRERVQQLRGGLDRLGVPELAGGERLAEGAAGHVLVGDVDVARVASEGVDALAARVAKRGGGTRLAFGALGDPALPPHHLERDVEPRPLVARQPDVTHPTRAERAHGTVTSEDQFGRERRRSHESFYFASRRSPFSSERSL